jgi:hypothetical protein
MDEPKGDEFWDKVEPELIKEDCSERVQYDL